MPLSLIAISWLTRHFFAGAEGSGIPQTLISLEHAGGTLSNKLLSLRVAVGKLLLTTLGLFAGASIGREGPSVHLGAAIMHSLGRYMHLSPMYIKRGLILTGGGAGIAAAFNTPLAGIVFAIEEMARSFDRRNTPMILAGIVLSGMTAIAVHQDNYSYFGTTPSEFNFNVLWVGVLVCGITGGLLGGAFSQTLISGSRLLPRFMSKHAILIAFTCGLLLAALGVLSDGTSYGTGYIEARQIVTCSGIDSCHAEFGFFYPLYKAMATIISYLSGVPGGIFAPTLAIGAGIGQDLAGLFPADLLATIVVLGMVGYFSGVVQTPITAFIIVMEMTNNQELVLALMATSLIAAGTSKIICRQAVYFALADNFLALLEQTSRAAGKDSPGKPT
jgi:H+/Cl- antiporter ClcA